MCVVFLWFVPLSAQMSHPLPGTSTSWELTETSRRKGYEQELHRSDEWMVEVPAPHCYFCSIFPNSCLFCIVSGGRYMLCVPPMCRFLQRREEGLRSPVAGVIGSCELPMAQRCGAGNRNQSLGKSVKCSYPRSHLQSLLLYLVFHPVIISCFIPELKGYVL